LTTHYSLLTTHYLLHTTYQILIQPPRYNPPHLRQLFMSTIKELDLAILSATILLIQWHKVITNLFNSLRRCKVIKPPVEADMRPWHNQFINGFCFKMF